MTITQPIQLPLFPGLAGTGTAFFLPGQDKAFVAPHAFGHHLNDSYDTLTTSGRLLLSPSREA
ncbi:MAG TPA: hypothetical protein VJC18_07795, partial [bacterium]|nr:hypothetical protein [bacterium]